MRRVMTTAGLWATVVTAAQAAPASGAAEAAGKYEAAMATAKQRIAAKDYPAAVEALEAAVAARPDDATALSELSWASFLTGDYAAAEQAGDRATGVARTNDLKAMALFNLGHAQEARGKLRAAWTTYKLSLGYRKNADVKARLAGLGAAMLTAHPLLGPFATPDAFCRGRTGCEVEHAFDSHGNQDNEIDVLDLSNGAASAPFAGMARILSQPSSEYGGFPDMNVALQVGDKWYVLAGVGEAGDGHGGGHHLEARMVGRRLVIAWSQSIGRFSHDDEATATVCGVAASGAPSCVGPLLTEQSSTSNRCDKDLSCHEPLVMSVDLHCRATLKGDVVTIENNPGKIDNPERAELSKPRAGACAELPWAGKHTLTF